jgi:hypothetical protein
MSETSATPPPLSSGPELGPIQRLTGVFVSPAKTFESIARKPGWDWLVPAAVLAAGVFVQQTVVVPKIDVDAAVKAQTRIVEKVTGHELSAKDRAEIERRAHEQVEAGKSPVRRGLTCLAVFIPILFVPLLYWGITAAFGGTTSYFKLLSGYAYTGVIQVIPLALSTLVAWPRATLDANEVQFQRILKSNVAAFLDWDTTNKALLALLSSLDVFDIWIFLVASIAVSKLTTFSKRGAYGVVGSVWGVYILVKVILAAVYGSFGG